MDTGEVSPMGAANEGAAHPVLVDERRLALHRAHRAEYIDGLLHPKDRRALYYAAIFCLLAAILVISLLIGPGSAPDDPDCRAPARAGVNWANCNLAGIDVQGADLSGANLSNATLRGARFMGARLARANLSYAALSRANLGYADLGGALLVGADLRHADLTNARLEGADLSYADLTGALLGGALLDNARLDNAIWVDGHSCATGATGACRAP